MTLIAINILLDPDPATVERGPGHEHSPTQRLSGRFRPRCQQRAAHHPAPAVCAHGDWLV